MNKILNASFFASALLFCSFSAKSQGIDYNKRKNTYVINDQVIAKLETKGNGFGKSRSFFVQDLNENNLIEFNNITVQDTFGAYHAWYIANFPTLKLQCYLDENMDLNNEKFFANIPIANSLLNTEGKLVEDACKKFITSNYFNNESAYNRFNDSLKALVSGPKPILQRNRKYPPYADANGRIGQGDDVLGKYEIKIIPNTVPGSTLMPKKIIYIKNSVGTLLAIYYSGSTEFTMFGKKKVTISLNPGATKVYSGNESDIIIINKIAEDLVNNNIL